MTIMRLQFVSNGRFSFEGSKNDLSNLLRILEMQVPNDSHSLSLSFQTKTNRVVFFSLLDINR